MGIHTFDIWKSEAFVHPFSKFQNFVRSNLLGLDLAVVKEELVPPQQVLHTSDTNLCSRYIYVPPTNFSFHRLSPHTFIRMNSKSETFVANFGESWDFLREMTRFIPSYGMNLNQQYDLRPLILLRKWRYNAELGKVDGVSGGIVAVVLFANGSQDV